MPPSKDRPSVEHDAPLCPGSIWEENETTLPALVGVVGGKKGDARGDDRPVPFV